MSNNKRSNSIVYVVIIGVCTEIDLGRALDDCWGPLEIVPSVDVSSHFSRDYDA